jgi:hypothetical protein
LEDKARVLEAMFRNSDRRGMESFMDDKRVRIPMVIFSGLMGAMVFASMMSFMGMAMNPAETAMAGDEANAEVSSGAVDTASVADDNGSSDAGAAADTNGRDLGGGFDF